MAAAITFRVTSSCSCSCLASPHTTLDGHNKPENAQLAQPALVLQTFAAGILCRLQLPTAAAPYLGQQQTRLLSQQGEDIT
jgi:hypothetical protein